MWCMTHTYWIINHGHRPPDFTSRARTEIGVPMTRRFFWSRCHGFTSAAAGNHVSELHGRGGLCSRQDAMASLQPPPPTMLPSCTGEEGLRSRGDGRKEYAWRNLFSCLRACANKHLTAKVRYPLIGWIILASFLGLTWELLWCLQLVNVITSCTVRS